MQPFKNISREKSYMKPLNTINKNSDWLTEKKKLKPFSTRKTIES